MQAKRGARRPGRPVDRRAGVKYDLIFDARGVPLAWTVTAATATTSPRCCRCLTRSRRSAAVSAGPGGARRRCLPTAAATTAPSAAPSAAAASGSGSPGAVPPTAPASATTADRSSRPSRCCTVPQARDLLRAHDPDPRRVRRARVLPDLLAASNRLLPDGRPPDEIRGSAGRQRAHCPSA